MASANLYLDKSRMNDQGEHPVYLRICHMRKQWPVSLKVSCTVKDYEKAVSDKGQLNSKQKELQKTLMDQRKKAQDVLNGLDVITVDTFKHAFYSEVDIVRIKDMLDIESQFKLYIDELMQQNRIRTAEVYASAMRSFVSFNGNIALQQITDGYLKRYESWMKAKGCSTSTASMMERHLRCIFNRAIKRKALNPKYYPFRDHTIAAVRKSKNALYPKQVEALLNYVPANDAQRRCKDYWFFSFLANGMNPKDIMTLKYSNLKKDKLTFRREKTIRTKHESDEIVLFLHPMAMEIIGRWGNPSKPNNYIFPAFNGCGTEQERLDALTYWRRHTNRILGRIGEKLGFDELNMGLARHSMATALAIKNIDINVISKMLGHNSITTTTHYIKSLPDETMRKINHDMLDFCKPQLKAV